MKRLIKGLLTFILLLVVGAVIIVVTTSPDKYRVQIADGLSKETGRTIKLDGPIGLSLSLHGAILTLRDAAIGNPPWASRKDMAGMGSFNLGVALLPLLSKQFVVTRLEIVNADIKLETDANGHHNWEIGPAEPLSVKSEKAKDKSQSAVTIHVDKVNVRDSQLIMADKDGKLNTFQVKSLTVGAEGSGGAIHFDGEYNRTPVTLAFKVEVKDFTSLNGAWPFDADLTYGNYKVSAKGNANADKSMADISSYDVTAGNSRIHGKLAVGWAGKPAVRGTIVSTRLNPADFKPATAQQEAGQGEAPPPAKSNHVFSDEPLDFEALKSFNADMTIKIDELPLASSELKGTSGRVEVVNGILTLNPFTTHIGDGAIETQIRLNAETSPAQLAMAAKAPEIKMQDVLNFLGAPDFISGNGYADMNIASSGNSVHELAANSVGVMNVSAGSGKISSSAAGSIANGLLAIFAPSGTNTLNCLVARFVLKNGIARDNGILVDTGAATIGGNGGFDLGRETIGMTLRAKTKQINIGSLAPPLDITGTFTNPHFTMDPGATIEKVAGIFSGNSLDGGVPDVISSKPGVNACNYTLDHPSAGTTAKPIVPANITDKLGAGINTLKGFLGQ